MDAVMLAVVLAGLALAAHYFSRRHLIRAMEKFPGPPAYPVIGNVIDLIRFKFNLSRAVEHWTAKYGPIFRIWVGTMPFVVLSKPEDLEILLSSNKHLQKSQVYDQIRPWIGDGLLTSKGQKWHTRRKLITPCFHFQILDQFVKVFNRHSDIFVEKLLSSKETINVHTLVTLCALDVICETAMGTKVDAQNNSKSPYVTAVHDAVLAFFHRTIKPWLRPDAVFNVSPDGRSFGRSITVLHKHTQDVIESRRKERENRRKQSLTGDEDMGLKKRVALLDQLLDINDSSDANLGDSDIREEVDTFMFAGHDTTAAALSFALYNVAAHPEVQARLAQEARDVFGDSERAATAQDIQAMKYAERVLKESLRLYPSVPLYARQLREDLPITDGYVLPVGANITITAQETGRNPAHWEDADRFDPDRHLPEHSARRHPYSFVAFSAGPRNCIGQKFAMMEMKALLCDVVRRCQIDLPSPGYKPRVEGQVILRAPEGVLLKFSPRKNIS